MGMVIYFMTVLNVSNGLLWMVVIAWKNYKRAIQSYPCNATF